MKERILERLFLCWRERGDGRALAAVFDLSARELLAVAAHLARDAAEAEDLVQATFVRAMEREPPQVLARSALGVAGDLAGVVLVAEPEGASAPAAGR